MKIAAFHLEPGGVGWHRVWCWSEGLKRLGHDVYHRPQEGHQFNIGELDDILRDRDVVIAGRMHRADSFAALLAGRHLYKYKLIVDTDDDQDSIPAYNQAHDDYHAGTGLVRLVRSELREADLVTVSTDALAAVERKYARQVVTIPNVIDPRMYQSVQSRQKEARHRDDIRIYWGGGGGHYDDLLVAKDAVLRVFHENPSVKLVFSNFIPDWAADLPPFRVFMIRFAKFNAYPKVLRWLCADIGIAPLVDNTFNQSKSHVKYLFYGMAGIPGVYSNLPPYESVEDGVTGLKVGKGQTWYDSLNALVEDVGLRQSIASAAQQDILDKWTVDRWLPRYEQMLCEAVALKSVPVPTMVTEGVPVEAPCLTTQA